MSDQRSDSAPCGFQRNNVTNFEISSSKTNKRGHARRNSWLKKFQSLLPSTTEIRQYIGVLLCAIYLSAISSLGDSSLSNGKPTKHGILGALIWGTSWFLFKELVLPAGHIFSMTAVVIVGYVFGHTLERYTTIHPVVGMTLIGALYRNIGTDNFLENPVANVIDFHLRRIYPVIILTRGPLGWNWEYIRNNSAKVFSLATLPWIVECLSTAVSAHVLLDFTWYWGLHLGAILASVSPAVVVPTCLSLSARGLGSKNQIALLVANAGGLDTAFTEGIFGVINSAIFYSAPPYYRILKAIFAIFLGIAVGVAWGVLIDCIPDHNDVYAPTIRSLLIFLGGLFISYGGAYSGWGGTSGVAIMVCAGTAATRWSRRGWPVNANPVSETYKLLWRIFEPMLFTLSGYYLEVSSISLYEFGAMACCILMALALRLLTAFLVSLANELSVRESLFIVVTWIPKAIVEAVLVRVAADSLWVNGSTSEDKRIARVHSNIIVIAILITSTLGSVLTTVLGPLLLSQDSRVAPAEIYSIQTQTAPQTSARSNLEP